MTTSPATGVLNRRFTWPSCFGTVRSRPMPNMIRLPSTICDWIVVANDAMTASATRSTNAFGPSVPARYGSMLDALFVIAEAGARPCRQMNRKITHSVQNVIEISTERPGSRFRFCSSPR
jgi:hypothetical protein